ncbi:MAG: hypothetical protein M3Y93_09105 [Pseudomonadota bacterium]|nr:hypothetical protein [Pseudomonadota bacterium]
MISDQSSSNQLILHIEIPYDSTPSQSDARPLYGFLCDYGRSYVRPLSILSVTVAIGAVPLWAHFGPWEFWQAVGLSLANTFGVLGIRKEFIESHVLTSLPGWLKVVAVMQTGLGVVLLFLFSLALRNRFRMK